MSRTPVRAGATTRSLSPWTPVLPMVYRVRKQLVEEGFEAVLSRKPRATAAVPRIFDGEKEAKLIALACSKPPQGYVRWTLRLLENKVVELGIVDRASDSTIGRTLKKTVSNPIAGSVGHPAEGQQRRRKLRPDIPNNSPASSAVNRCRSYARTAQAPLQNATQIPPIASLSVASAASRTSSEHGGQLTRYKRRTIDALPTREDRGPCC